MAKEKDVKPITKVFSKKALYSPGYNPIETKLMDYMFDEEYFINTVYRDGFSTEDMKNLADCFDDGEPLQEFEIRITAEIIPLKKYTFSLIPSLKEN